MKRIAMVAGLALLSAACAWGKSYVVTSKGEGFWASRVRMATNIVVYYVPEGGDTEKFYNMDDIAGIIPSVERGRQYGEQEITDATGLIDKMARRFFPLRKHLIQLNQQWQVLRTPETGVEEKIGALVRRFDASSKDPAVFRDLTLQMDMIRFKDVAGTYSNQVDAALTKMSTAYFEAHKGNLDTMLSSSDTSLAHFAACKKEVDSVSQGYLAKEQKQRLDAALQKRCDDTIKAGINAARQSLSNSKTVDSYLEGASALRELKLATADNAKPPDAVEKAIYGLRALAAQTLPGYDCSIKGCPLSEEDRRIMGEGKRFASSSPIRSLSIDEQAYMFPTNGLGKIEGDTFRLPLRIVFNRIQPKGRVYFVGGEISVEGDKPKVFLWKVPPLEIRDGHADTVLQAPAVRLTGSEVSIFLACKDDSVPQGEPEKWIGLSLGCKIPVGNGR
ncbi:MAG: hypothetical protein WCL44_04045 [bacterium]